MKSRNGLEQGRVRRAVAVSLLMAPGLLAVAPAYAQEKAAAIELEEVVVTARKAEEKLTEVPLSIAAYSADELAKRNTTSLYDIAQYTAGFSFENYSGGTAPAPLMRGLTQNALTDRNQNVGSFVDGVHVQQQGNIDFSLLDLERIEIVKGPQNAQYGRSSFAGAINWVPKKPSLDKVDGSLRMTLGTDERRDLAVSVSLPIIKDMLAIRVGGTNTEFDGTWKNNYPGSTKAVKTTVFGKKFDGTDGNLGGYNNRSRQVSARFRPIEQLTVDAMYYRSENIYEAGASYNLQPRAATVVPALGYFNPLNCSPRLVTNTAQLLCGEMKITPSQIVADPRASGNHTHSDLTVGRVEYKISDSLTATYVYGRGSYDAANYGASFNQPEVLVNGDRTAAIPGGLIFVANPLGDQNSRSNEFRLDGKVGDIGWRVGYYKSNVTDIGALGLYTFRLPLSVDPTGQSIPFSLADANFQSRFTDATKATFASITIPFNSFTLEAEGRSAKENRRQQPQLPTAFVPAPKNFSEFTPRVNLKWQPQAGWMFYGSIAKGSKAGGFNGVTADVATFDPEKNTTYEIGGKQSLMNGTLQLNYAAFFIDWKKLQLSVPDTIPSKPGIQDANYIGNVSGAESKGVELEAIYLAADNLKLNFAGSYVQSTFNSDVVDTTFGRLCETGGTAACTFLPRSTLYPLGGSPIGGNDLPRTPRSKFSAGAEYLMPLSAGISLTLRGDLNYQSKYYVENLNLAYIPNRTLVNLDATFSSEDRKWSASLWAKNATDKTYVSSAFAVSVINQYIPAIADGRTMGMTLRYSF
ncbi:MAG: hypothetical protein RL603_1464 [Pseudomonadota bacterium]|jgi:iron complex outermembrane receptor protein